MRTAQNRAHGLAGRRVKGNTRRVLAVVALLVTALALSACAPAAEWLRDQLDSHEGATLDFLPEGGGVVFDPDGRAAYGVHITLRGEGLVLADGQEECFVSEDARYVDCDYALVTSPQVVYLTGSGVIGSAAFTREPDSIAWVWAYTPVQ